MNIKVALLTKTIMKYKWARLQHFKNPCAETFNKMRDAATAISEEVCRVGDDQLKAHREACKQLRELPVDEIVEQVVSRSRNCGSGDTNA